VSRLARGARAALASWDRFWFAPESTSTLAVVRIAFALVVLGWTAALGHDLVAFHSRSGVLPEQPDLDQVVGPGAWGLLGTFESDGALLATYLALFVAALMLLVGLKTRLAAVVVFIGLMALTRRNVWVLDSGDPLIRSIAFFLMLAPSGAALSLDRRFAARRGRAEPGPFPLRAPWALRLMQIQLSVLYLSAVWFKVGGETWRDGTAVSYALRIENLQRFPLPDALTTSELASNVLTFGTLAVELALGLLVWNRRLRPWVLLAGVGLHLGIDYAIRVGFFSYAILVLYLAFVPPETMDRWLLALRSRLDRLRRRRAPGTEAAQPGAG
jgi:uncharacterized membrane protein YphA (DoxX/SURF4 family)